MIEYYLRTHFTSLLQGAEREIAVAEVWRFNNFQRKVNPAVGKKGMASRMKSTNEPSSSWRRVRFMPMPMLNP